uniref:Uncharacterized protein n=1 Tax=viral metagenome TaxID=1070528 RepID=A0A6C0L6Q2_9ZZZZ
MLATGSVKSVKLPSVRETVGFLDAKHLVDGNPLKQSLPLQLGNILEEHG